MLYRNIINENTYPFSCLCFFQDTEINLRQGLLLFSTADTSRNACICIYVPLLNACTATLGPLAGAHTCPGVRSGFTLELPLRGQLGALLKGAAFPY